MKKMEQINLLEPIIIFKPTAFINVDFPQALVPNKSIPSFLSSIPKSMSFVIYSVFVWIFSTIGRLISLAFTKLFLDSIIFGR